MKKYDVIICGAGPAGTVAAIILARNNFSVLLLDKESFPRDKVCGDQLPPSGTELLYNLDILDEEFLHNCNSVNAASITSPSGRKINFLFEFLSKNSKPYTIPREKLDYKLYQIALNSGVEFVQTKLVDVEVGEKYVNVFTKTENLEEKYIGKVLVAADGSNSKINQILGHSPENIKGIAIRSYVDGINCDPQKIESFFLEHLKKGYVWIFPFSDTSANIGLGMDMVEYRSQEKNLKQFLIDFMEMPQIQKRLSANYEMNSIKAWPLNIGPPNWKTMAQNRLIKVGDAAGLINPGTGGGIVNAILSGKIAAEVLMEKLSSDELDEKSLKLYISRLKKQINREMTMTYWLQSFVVQSSRNLEFLIKLASKSTLPYKLANKIFTDVRLTLIK